MKGQVIAYKVVPFVAGVTRGDGAEKAAAQLEALADDMEKKGWKFLSLENIETVVTTPAIPGSNGCLGVGATPTIAERRDSTQVYVAIFEKKS